MSRELPPEAGLPDAVIDEESARTYNVKGTVFIIEEGCGSVSFENPVPLIGTDGKQIGVATLSVEGKYVVADMYFRYDCPERLTIETKSAPLYVWPWTLAELSDWNGRVGHLNILLVSLDEKRPNDERIDPL